MVHEHQRWDRDDYVEFRCRNIDGNKKDKKVTEDEAWDKLCTDEAEAYEYNAPSMDYIKGNGLDPVTKSPLDGPDGFDLDSIMMYTSSQGTGKYEDEVTVDTAVLVKIKKDDSGKVTPAEDWRIPTREEVSDKDAEFVRRFYPWGQEAYDEYKRTHPDKA